jgi:AcrR family transcriptional regulator
MRSTTRQRLVEAAARRFYRDGFRNVGLDQVLADAGISKTAFYKDFGCKEDLVLAALEMKQLWLEETLRATIHEVGGASPLGRLRAVLDVVDRILATDDFQGCIFVKVAMEYPLAHDPAHIAAARHKQAMEVVIRDLAAEAGAPDPVAFARQLCLVLEGAYVTRQVTGKRDTIDVARRVVDLVIAAHLGGESTRTQTRT